MLENAKLFEKSFNEFISKRLNEDSDSLIENCTEISEMYKDANRLYKKILAAFDKGNNEAFEQDFDKYASVHNTITGTIAELSYLQGMKDSYKLMKIIESDDRKDKTNDLY